MAVVQLVAWMVLGAAAGMPLGLLIGVLWAPFLRDAGVREAVENGPVGAWWGNYAAGFALLGGLHMAGVAFLVAAGVAVPDVVVGVPVLAGVVGAFLLVRRMREVEDVLRVYVVVMGGVLWYVVLTVPLTFLAVGWFLPS